MKIGIIGAGFIGRAVARLAGSAGHDVMLSNSRGPDTLHSAVRALGCRSGTVEDAAAHGDLVVIAIPLRNYRALPPAPLVGKIVLDANNYYPQRDGRMAELDDLATTTSELLARHLPDARIVKAFNAILAADLEADGRPPGALDRRALPIAGDDGAAKTVASRLLDEIGFDVVDAGPLSEGWRFERGMPAFCIRFDPDGLRDALARAQRGVTAALETWRAGRP